MVGEGPDRELCRKGSEGRGCQERGWQGSRAGSARQACRKQEKGAKRSFAHPGSTPTTCYKREIP